MASYQEDSYRNVMSSGTLRSCYRCKRYDDFAMRMIEMSESPVYTKRGPIRLGSGIVEKRAGVESETETTEMTTTMYILHFPFAVFSFSVKLSSLALASKVRIILHYSHLCIHFFKKT